MQQRVLAKSRAGDHAGDLVPRSVLAARRLRACRQDRGRTYQEVPWSQNGGLRVGCKDVHEEGNPGRIRDSKRIVLIEMLTKNHRYWIYWNDKLVTN